LPWKDCAEKFKKCNFWASWAYSRAYHNACMTFNLLTLIHDFVYRRSKIMKFKRLIFFINFENLYTLTLRNQRVGFHGLNIPRLVQKTTSEIWTRKIIYFFTIFMRKVVEDFHFRVICRRYIYNIIYNPNF